MTKKIKTKKGYEVNEIEELEKEIDRLRSLKRKVKNQEESMDKNWFNEEKEGELAVDVYQDKNNIIIKSTIGGVKAKDLDISINNNIITIRGERRQEENVKKNDYFYQECYWGKFSRSIVLPQEVGEEKIKATLKNGLLTIVLPKAKVDSEIKIKVKAEE